MKVGDARIYDANFMLHIGGDRVMANRASLGLVDAGSALIRGNGTNVFLANSAGTRDAAMQLHVGPNRAWAKDLCMS